MLLKHFFVPKIAHSSYMLAGDRTCAIIDPRRDVQIYLDAAKSLDMKITHVIETHLHADFISGHIDLARATGATIYAPRAGRCAFPHVPVREGDTIEIENVLLRVLDTPGHTPEHVSYVAIDRARGRSPVGVFCGDTLFVGDVGRPDLFPGKARQLASKLFDSLRKLTRLPDHCEIYPAHGAGSLCGRAMGAKWRSTIGYEKRYNEPLGIRNRETFIQSLTTDMPAAPDHFARCSDINRRGPARLETLPAPRPLAPELFRARAGRRDRIVLDVRSFASFGGLHVAGAYNIDRGGNFPTFAGWILPPDKKLLLVGEHHEIVEEAAVWLHRVGLDRIEGCLDGGMFDWAKEGYATAHVRQISTHELHGMVTGGSRFTILDTRSPREFADNHIRGAVNIPVAGVRTRWTELDPETPMAIICSTGHRSSLAASILLQHGFTELMNVAGGMTGYTAAGYTKRCGVCFIPHASHYLGSRSSGRLHGRGR